MPKAKQAFGIFVVFIGLHFFEVVNIQCVV